LMQPIGWQVETKGLDGDKTIGGGVVSAEHGTECAGTDLVKNTERSERVRRRGAGGIRVQ
jgi:hypothetical protein